MLKNGNKIHREEKQKRQRTGEETPHTCGHTCTCSDSNKRRLGWEWSLKSALLELTFSENPLLINDLLGEHSCSSRRLMGHPERKASFHRPGLVWKVIPGLHAIQLGVSLAKAQSLGWMWVRWACDAEGEVSWGTYVQVTSYPAYDGCTHVGLLIWGWTHICNSCW